MNIRDILEKRIQELKKEENRYQKYLDGILTIRKVQERLLDVNLDQMDKFFPNEYSEKEIQTLKNIQVILDGNRRENLGFELVPMQVESIQEFIHKNETIVGKILQDLGDNRKMVEELLRKVQSSDAVLNPEDLEQIYKIIQDNNLSSSDVYKLLTELLFLNKRLFDSHEIIASTSQIEKEKPFDEENLKEVFARYKIDITKVKDIAFMIENGSLSNIEAILKICKDNLMLRQLDYTERSFAHILTLSTPENVQKMMNIAKLYGLEWKELWNYPANFISERQDTSCIKVHRRSKKTTLTETKKKPITKETYGNSEDFFKNIEYIKEIGLDIERILKSTLSSLSIRNYKLKENIDLLEFYGFNIHAPNFPYSTLSCNILALDRFLEAGAYPLILKSPSYLSSYTNRLFYNLYYLRQNGEEFLDKNGGLSSEVRSGIILPAKEEAKIINLEEAYKKAGMKELNSYYQAAGEGNFRDNQLALTDEAIQKLEKWMVPNNPLLYDIEGVLISRLKTLRIYNQILLHGELDTEKGLLFALTYNSLLNQKDFDKVKNQVEKCFAPKVEGGIMR